MCYTFTLYLGCGHDRSDLFFRPLPQTKACLCRTLFRERPSQGLCPSCDRLLKISRGLWVEPDPLTSENRRGAQAWREKIDTEIKNREIGKSYSQAEKYPGIKTGATAVVKVDSVPNVKTVGIQLAGQNGKKGGKPPYVQQPGETYIEHIIAEVIDDARSGGETARLSQANHIGTHGLGWVGSSYEHTTSWLMLSANQYKKTLDQPAVVERTEQQIVKRCNIGKKKPVNPPGFEFPARKAEPAESFIIETAIPTSLTLIQPSQIKTIEYKTPIKAPIKEAKQVPKDNNVNPIVSSGVDLPGIPAFGLPPMKLPAISHILPYSRSTSMSIPASPMTTIHEDEIDDHKSSDGSSNTTLRGYQSPAPAKVSIRPKATPFPPGWSFDNKGNKIFIPYPVSNKEIRNLKRNSTQNGPFFKAKSGKENAFQKPVPPPDHRSLVLFPPLPLASASPHQS